MSEGERDLRAAEYVLGTLSAAERAAFERERTVDPATAGAVLAWELRLAPLSLAAPAAIPSPDLWTRIARALPPRGDTAANDDRVLRLGAQVRRWRLAAAGAGLLAAGLALFVAVDRRSPDAVAPGTRYLAVVQGGGALPAMVVRIDTAAGTAQVRPVGAEAPAGRSLELWYVGAGAAPKTLGLVGGAVTQVALPPGTAADDVLAVSVEPPGGSPSGAPTGPVVYTGKLIRE
ncbi:anti-sigma factor domain-containing protein [uncultured Methylobacterium sp.]|uniref:anti-sigma factor n=1 Tax=uncultured Methylobacterium sp. TaxID=157278 RepID=UPI0035CBC315